MGLEVAHTQYGGCTHHVKKSQGTSTKLRRSLSPLELDHKDWFEGSGNGECGGGVA